VGVWASKAEVLDDVEGVVVHYLVLVFGPRAELVHRRKDGDVLDVAQDARVRKEDVDANAVVDLALSHEVAVERGAGEEDKQKGGHEPHRVVAHGKSRWRNDVLADANLGTNIGVVVVRHRACVGAERAGLEGDGLLDIQALNNGRLRWQQLRNAPTAPVMPQRTTHP
jgi:hypothetical protein